MRSLGERGRVSGAAAISSVGKNFIVCVCAVQLVASQLARTIRKTSPTPPQGRPAARPGIRPFGPGGPAGPRVTFSPCPNFPQATRLAANVMAISARNVEEQICSLLMKPIKMQGVPPQHSRSRFAVKQDLCRLLDVVGAPAIGKCVARRIPKAAHSEQCRG